MKQIEEQPVATAAEELRRHWQKPEVSRISAGAAENGDNFSGEGGGSFS